MVFTILLLIIGFIILIKGADFFVDSASSIALHLNISKVIIGLTIVAFGTSAPEFAVSIKALMHGSGDLVLGNVIGSNIINSLLVLGIASVIYPLSITRNTVRKELPLALLISTLLMILFLDIGLNGAVANVFTRSDGIAVVLFFMVFLYYLITVLRKRDKTKKDEDIEMPKYPLSKSIILAIIGVASIVLGSNLVVDNAVLIAEQFNISERVISLTIIAFGTSLPEIVTSITAALKKENGIIMGNIVGSNIFNICIVLGIPVSLFGAITPNSDIIIDLLILVIGSICMFVFSIKDHKIFRYEGIIMLILFFIYYSYVFISI